MSKKVNPGEVDKRIQARRAIWSAEDREALEAGLRKLPDLAEQVEIVALPQPAVGGSEPPSPEPASRSEAVN